MTNAAYQAVLAELEKLLPPRAVSHMLKEGLAALGRTPATLSVADIEPLLRGPLHGYLRQQLHDDRAAAAVEAIIGRLHDPSARLLEQTPAWTEKLRGETEELTARLSHYNLYFDWPEVQDLRSRVNQVHAQLESGTDVREQLDEARARLVRLEDRLSAELGEQTRRISALQAAAGAVTEGSDRRARRLHTLIRQLQDGMEQQVLMPAELGRAERLLDELLEPVPAPGTAEVTEAAAAVSMPERLARLENELAENTRHRTQTGDQLAQLLTQLRVAAEAGPSITPAEQEELTSGVARAEELLHDLKAEAEAARTIAGSLSSPGSLERLLSSIGPARKESRPEDDDAHSGNS